MHPHASRLQPFATPGELPVLMDASRGGGSTPMSRVTATGKSPAMPQTEEEEEADARDDGQSSSHASHNGDGGAYGNSAGSIGPTPRSGGRSNQHSNRSNPGTAQGRPHVAALQGLKQQQQRRQSNEVLGHNRRAAHSMPHRGPGGSGPGSRVNSRPPSVGQSRIDASRRSAQLRSTAAGHGHESRRSTEEARARSANARLGSGV